MIPRLAVSTTARATAQRTGTACGARTPIDIGWGSDTVECTGAAMAAASASGTGHLRPEARSGCKRDATSVDEACRIPEIDYFMTILPATLSSPPLRPVLCAPKHTPHDDTDAAGVRDPYRKGFVRASTMGCANAQRYAHPEAERRITHVAYRPAPYMTWFGDMVRARRRRWAWETSRVRGAVRAALLPVRD